MRPSRFTGEQIIGMRKEQEAGAKTADVCRKHGISTATFYKFKVKFGGMDVSNARRLKTLRPQTKPRTLPQPGGEPGLRSWAPLSNGARLVSKQPDSEPPPAIPTTGTGHAAVQAHTKPADIRDPSKPLQLPASPAKRPAFQRPKHRRTGPGASALRGLMVAGAGDAL